jgi:hypothetical protein
MELDPARRGPDARCHWLQLPSSDTADVAEAPPAGGYESETAHERCVRRAHGLVLALLSFAAFAALPAAASADPADPYVAFSFQDGWFYPQGADVDYRVSA